MIFCFENRKKKSTIIIQIQKKKVLCERIFKLYGPCEILSHGIPRSIIKFNPLTIAGLIIILTNSNNNPNN